MDWPCSHALGRPAAVFRESAADFRVEEDLGFALTGEGEHLWVLVEKTDLNTIDVMNSLSRASGCRKQDIGYAGLKDRQAVARQWFSLKTPNELDPGPCETANLRLVSQQRNARKLRQGSHRGNRFVITLRGVDLQAEDVAAATALLGRKGVPNYVGPQRFGRDGRNIHQALAMFGHDGKKIPRFQRGIYLSAARAFLFNKVLASRVVDGSWDTCLPGDVMALAGSGSVFKSEAEDTALAGRLAAGDIHPTGPLWGRGSPATGAQALAVETAVAEAYRDLAAGLEQAGLKQERRPLRLMPEDLRLVPGEGGQLVIEFGLPKGAFATSVLRELVSATGL